MRFTILKGIKSTLLKSLFYNYCSTNQIKCWLLMREENISGRQVLSPLGQPACHPEALALRNYSEGYKINKPLSGSLVYPRIMLSAERLSSKFHSCPRSFASRPTVHFSDPSALSIILRYTSRRKGFIY